MASLITCVRFIGDARKAAEFYAATFPNSRIDTSNPSPVPGVGENDEPTVEFTVLGHSFVGLNGAPDAKPTVTARFLVVADSPQDAERYRNAIFSNGGGASATGSGWCYDRWGVAWLISNQRGFSLGGFQTSNQGMVYPSR